MSIGVDMVNGRYESAYARRSAWHRRMGLFVPDRAMTDEEILEAISFQAAKRAIYRFVPDTLPGPNEPWPQAGSVPGRFDQIIERAETYRTDLAIDAYGRFGDVGADYALFQTRELLDTFQGLPLDREAAFALHGGRQVVIVGKVQGAETILGDGQDRLLPYLVIRTSHDGSVPVEVMLVSFRPECANMTAMAADEASKRGTIIRLRHAGAVHQRARDAAKVLDQCNVQMAKHGAAAAKMLERHLTEAEFALFLDEVMPLPSPLTRAGKANPQFTRAVESKDLVRALYRNSPTLTRIRGTAWAAFNAVTEYIDHVRGTDDVATRSATEGHGAQVKARAWKEAMVLVK